MYYVPHRWSIAFKRLTTLSCEWLYVRQHAAVSDADHHRWSLLLHLATCLDPHYCHTLFESQITFQDLMQFFQQGILNGFRISYKTNSTLHSTKRNLEGVYLHPHVVEEYLQIEIDFGILASSYSQPELAEIHTSRLGVILKRHQPGKWQQLIANLLYPKNHNINNGIPRSLCELHYITVDGALQKIVQLVQDSYLQKLTLKALSVYSPSIQRIITCWPCAGNKDFTSTPVYLLGSGLPLNYLTS